MERRTDDVRARIDRFLVQHGLAARGARVVPLTGDAGDRRYVRLLLAGEPSQVLAVYPGPVEFETLPFVNVWRLFNALPVPVPRMLVCDDALGIMAQQDLGDVTLQAHLGSQPAGEHAALYAQAVSFIDTMQWRGAELTSPQYLPYGIAFDVDKLTWELQFFVRHFLEGYRGAVLSDDDRAALADDFAALAGELAGEPRVLCHRDYHSRNLMLHGDQLYIIDFQDARLGPDTYDLVSLLRDSYMDLTDAQVDDLIERFLSHRRARGAGVDTAAFRRRFDVMAVQRNLKALGTFGFQTTARQNPVYIQYIPRTLHYLRANLLKYPRFARLHRVLAAHLDELR